MSVVRISNSRACGWPTLTWDEMQVSFVNGKAHEQLGVMPGTQDISPSEKTWVLEVLESEDPGSQGPVGPQLSLVSVLQTVTSFFSLCLSPLPPASYTNKTDSALCKHTWQQEEQAVAVFHMGPGNRSDPGCAVFVLENKTHP